jgi:hypothetical protein
MFRLHPACSAARAAAAGAAARAAAAATTTTRGNNTHTVGPGIAGEPGTSCTTLEAATLAAVGEGWVGERREQDHSCQHGAGKQDATACSRRRDRNRDVGNRSVWRAPLPRRAARCHRTHAM